MSIAIHPNTLEARAWRQACIRHACRQLYRDPKWHGDIKLIDWLRRFHYVPSDVTDVWPITARVNPLKPMDELSEAECGRLIRVILDYARGSR